MGACSSCCAGKLPKGCCNRPIDEHASDVCPMADSFSSRSFIRAFILQDRTRNGLYEPLLQENEREAVADLLQFLESKCLQ